MGNSIKRPKIEKTRDVLNLQPLNVHHGQEMPVSFHATSRKHLALDGFTPNPNTFVGMASNSVTQGMQENTLPNNHFHPKASLRGD